MQVRQFVHHAANVAAAFRMLDQHYGDRTAVCGQANGYQRGKEALLFFAMMAFIREGAQKIHDAIEMVEIDGSSLPHLSRQILQHLEHRLNPFMLIA
jgi:hypothetical protein